VSERPPRRFTNEQRADLVDWTRIAIQGVWDDVGPTTAQVLADNIVSSQEFLWLSMHFPVAVPVEPMGGHDVRAERFESGVVYVACNVCGSGAGYYESWTQ